MINLPVSILFSALVLCLGCASVNAQAQQNVAKDSIVYHDGHEFDIVGKYHGEKNYVRLPEKFKNSVRDKVWNLAQNTAGIGIRFHTNATTISVKWTLKSDTHLRHMPDTGVKGVDLYAFNGSEWQYVLTGFPSGKENEYTLLADGDGIAREYLLNLPLYAGVESLEIGVNASAEITKARNKYLLSQKPVVYYGTSIAQGGCASRPGLAFTSIMARDINVPFINLGFSGNGTMETSVGEAMTEIDAGLYVIDCNPNTEPELIYDRTLALVQQLRKARPEVAILLVEGFLSDNGYFNPAQGVHTRVKKKQQELRRAFDDLRKMGIKKLHYRNGDGLVGNDHEGTVDGIHPNDLGMMRIAEALLPTIKKLL